MNYNDRVNVVFIPFFPASSGALLANSGMTCFASVILPNIRNLLVGSVVWRELGLAKNSLSSTADIFRIMLIQYLCARIVLYYKQ